MEMYLNDWEFDDLKKEISEMSTVAILDLFVEKDKEYTKTCVLFVDTEMNKEIEKECNKLYQEKLVIAMKLADRLTGVSSTL